MKKKHEPSPTSMRRDIPFHSEEFGQDGYRHFVGFQPHFHLNMTSQAQCCKPIKNESAISQESLSI